MSKTIKSSSVDAMADARKNEKFKFYSRGASLKIRLAVEIYNARESKKISQQELAKAIFSTQKVISRIENGDVNIGIEMLDRLSEELDFTLDNFSKIFTNIQSSKVKITSMAKQSEKKVSPDLYFNSGIIRKYCNIFISPTVNAVSESSYQS